MSEENKKHPQMVGVRLVRSASAPAPVKKAETMTHVEPEEQFNAGDWIEHPYSFDGLEALVEHSTILPQCITAYKNNVCGFGLSIDYLDEYKQWDEEEHPEIADEYTRVQRIVDLLSLDQDTKDLFGAIVATRERFGIAYIEVVRNLGNEVVEIANVRRPGTMHMTVPLDPYVDVAFYYKGEAMNRKRRFRKYRQEVGGKYIYFKESGDPRIMDKRTGEYLKDGNELEIGNRANEIIALPIGDKPYGEVRWIGQVTGMDGAAKAEALNANYFENGRHTPMMIMIDGGTLTDESFRKQQEYMEGIKGEAGQHAFMVLESETTTEVKTGLEQETAPKITVKDLSPMLQKDELFQGYIDNARKKVQSSFLLPDLYVGYTTDFNRATSQTAMEVTEKQVFIPYRQEMAWLINRRLLAEYQFKYCEITFRAPDITNPDDQSKILTIVERAGGLTPNEAHRLAGTMVGDTAEDFTGDWADVPLAVQKVINENAAQQPAQTPETPVTPPSPEVMEQVDARVEDAEQTGNDELIAVMRQVRKALVELTDDRKVTTASAFAPVSTPTERSMVKAEKRSLGSEPEVAPVKASMRQFMMTPKKRGDNSDA